MFLCHCQRKTVAVVLFSKWSGRRVQLPNEEASKLLCCAAKVHNLLWLRSFKHQLSQLCVSQCQVTNSGTAGVRGGGERLFLTQ